MARGQNGDNNVLPLTKEKRHGLNLNLLMDLLRGTRSIYQMVKHYSNNINMDMTIFICCFLIHFLNRLSLNVKSPKPKAN